MDAFFDEDMDQDFAQYFQSEESPVSEPQSKTETTEEQTPYTGEDGAPPPHGSFCTAHTLESAASYINHSLSALGLIESTRPLAIGSDGPNNKAAVLNVMYALIQQRQRDLATQGELTENIHRLTAKNASLAEKVAVLEAKLHKAEGNSERAELDLKRAVAERKAAAKKAAAAEATASKLKAAAKSSANQYKHSLHKEERRYAKLQKRLHSLASSPAGDRGLGGPAAASTAGVSRSSSAARRRDRTLSFGAGSRSGKAAALSASTNLSASFSTAAMNSSRGGGGGGSKSFATPESEEKAFLQKVLADTQRSHSALAEEVSSLRVALVSVQREILDMFEDEFVKQALGIESIDVAAIDDQRAHLPLELVQSELEECLVDRKAALERRLAELVEATARTSAVEVLEAKVAEKEDQLLYYEAQFEEQSALLQRCLDMEAAGGSGGSGGGAEWGNLSFDPDADLSGMAFEQEQLAGERELFEAQRARFETERKALEDEGLKLAREKAIFKHEKEQLEREVARLRMSSIAMAGAVPSAMNKSSSGVSTPSRAPLGALPRDSDNRMTTNSASSGPVKSQTPLHGHAQRSTMALR